MSSQVPNSFYIFQEGIIGVMGLILPIEIFLPLVTANHRSRRRFSVHVVVGLELQVAPETKETGLVFHLLINRLNPISNK